MRNSRQFGFALVDLLVLIVVIVIVAGVAVPHLQKGITANDNGNTFAALRKVAGAEVDYYSQNNRFARLSEINNLQSASIGTPSGNELTRGKWVLSMNPVNPTDADLKSGYSIIATRNVPGEGVTYVYELTENGEIRQLLP
jgi:Tfp pilus assembly protein PilE